MGKLRTGRWRRSRLPRVMAEPAGSCRRGGPGDSPAWGPRSPVLGGAPILSPVCSPHCVQRPPDTKPQVLSLVRGTLTGLGGSLPKTDGSQLGPCGSSLTCGYPPRAPMGKGPGVCAALLGSFWAGSPHRELGHHFLGSAEPEGSVMLSLCLFTVL